MRSLIKNIKSNRIDTRIDILLESLDCSNVYSDDFDDILPIWVEYRKDGELIFEVAPNLKEIYLDIESLRVFNCIGLDIVKQRIIKMFKYTDYIFVDYNLTMQL